MAYTKRADAELLRAALAGYQHQHEVLGKRIAEITRELSGRTEHAGLADVAKPKRTMSELAGRKNARWPQHIACPIRRFRILWLSLEARIGKQSERTKPLARVLVVPRRGITNTHLVPITDPIIL